MVCRLITGFSFVSLCLCTGLSTGFVVAAERGGELVHALVQEPQQTLPEENAATFRASDPRIRVQLVRLDRAAGSFAGSSVTVINPQGKTTALTADSKGVVSLSKVTAGLHAVVVSGADGHAAVPLVLREVTDEISEGTLPEDPALISNDAVTTVHLPVMAIDPREVLRVASAFLPPATAAGSVRALDDQAITEAEVGGAHLFRATLEPTGRMEGRIISLLPPDVPQADLAGTAVMIYSGNQLVARSITDDQGRFAAHDLRPGIHGLIAAGPAGYAAFAFDADVAGEGIVRRSGTSTSDGAASYNGEALVRMNQPGMGLPLPVVLIPTPLVPSVVGAIREGQAPPAVGVEPLPPGFAPVPGGGFAGGAGGAVGGGGGGLGGAAGGGLGGAGGLLALGGIGAAVAAAAADDDNDRPIVFPPVATPAEPGPVAP